MGKGGPDRAKKGKKDAQKKVGKSPLGLLLPFPAPETEKKKKSEMSAKLF